MTTAVGRACGSWFTFRLSVPSCNRRHDAPPSSAMTDGTSKSPRHTRVTDPDDPECEVRTILDRIADKWSLLVVCILADGTKRFVELRREVDGISQRMLTHTLR